MGQQAIIIANANDRRTPQTAQFINGYFMECYRSWERSLGEPTAERQSRPDGTVSREFQHGTVVYNPLGNRPETVRFPEQRRAVATGKADDVHAVGCPNGDIFLRLN